MEVVNPIEIEKEKNVITQNFVSLQNGEKDSLSENYRTEENNEEITKSDPLLRVCCWSARRVENETAEKEYPRRCPNTDRIKILCWACG